MTFVYYVIVAIHVFICFFLIAVVLLQQGKNQDLASAFGGGGTQTAFGPRGSANVLSRATTVLAGFFVVTSLLLTLLRPRPTSVLDTLPATAPSPAPSGPATPGAPVAPETAPQSESAPAPAAFPSPAQ